MEATSQRNTNKIQSCMADFPPVPPPGELDETYALSLILAYSVHYIKTWRHPQNREIHSLLHCRQRRPSHGYSWHVQKYGEMWMGGFGEIRERTDGQKNERTGIVSKLQRRAADRVSHRNITLSVRLVTPRDVGRHIRLTWQAKLLAVR